MSPCIQKLLTRVIYRCKKLLRRLKLLSHFTVYTDPWIACPIDRVEELEPDKSTVVLGYKWQLPRTNMKHVTVSPSNYDENYPFPVGSHRVTWMGTSDSGTQISCSFHISVNGEMLLKVNFASNTQPVHTTQHCSYMGAWASQATVPFI